MERLFTIRERERERVKLKKSHNKEFRQISFSRKFVDLEFETMEAYIYMD